MGYVKVWQRTNRALRLHIESAYLWHGRPQKFPCHPHGLGIHHTPGEHSRAATCPFCNSPCFVLAVKSCLLSTPVGTSPYSNSSCHNGSYSGIMAMSCGQLFCSSCVRTYMQRSTTRARARERERLQAVLPHRGAFKSKPGHDSRTKVPVPETLAIRYATI